MRLTGPRTASFGCHGVVRSVTSRRFPATLRICRCFYRTQYAYATSSYFDRACGPSAAYEVAAGSIPSPISSQARSPSNALDAGMSPTGLTPGCRDAQLLRRDCVCRTLTGSTVPMARSRSEQLVLMKRDRLLTAQASRRFTLEAPSLGLVASVLGCCFIKFRYQNESTRYYAQTSRAQYDFQDAAVTSPRGLLQNPKTRRAYHRGPVRQQLRAVSGSGFTDPAGSDDRRTTFILQPKQITDPNGNVSSIEFTRLAFVKAFCQREDH